MLKSKIIDEIIQRERKRPTFSHHHLNSYITNLPIEDSNKELKDILKYFQSAKVYLPLFQEKEFKHGLSIEVKAELTDEYDLLHGIHYRESLFHNHDFFEMMFVYSGTCSNYIGDIKMQLKEGDLLLYNLQTVHKLIIDDPDAVIFNILVGKEIFNQSFMELFSTDDPLFQFYIHSLYNIPDDQYIQFHLQDEDASLQILYDLIKEFVCKEELYTRIMQMDFQNLLVHLARIRLKTRAINSTKDKNTMDINEVLQYIHDHYKDITLQSLSDHYSYTTRSMIRFLKKYTHMIFSDILKEYKMIIACNYLKNTDMNIDAIAYETGFKERGYFDKVFKQVYKITPHEYRNQYSQE